MLLVLVLVVLVADSVGGVGDSSGVGDDGTGGEGPGSAGDSGWNDGGPLPVQANDTKGIKDTLRIPVSGGEHIMPADVVGNSGMLPALELIRNMFHKPVRSPESDLIRYLTLRVVELLLHRVKQWKDALQDRTKYVRSYFLSC